MSIFAQKNNKQRKAFTLLEAVLAISLMAAILMQVLNITTSSIYINEKSMNTMQATWALRQLLSQTEYVLDVYGSTEIPENLEIPWSGNPNFKLTLTKTNLEVTPKGIIQSIVRGFLGEEAAQGTQLLDAQLKNLPTQIFQKINLKVTWTQGDSQDEQSLDWLIVNQGTKSQQEPPPAPSLLPSQPTPTQEFVTPQEPTPPANN